MNENGDLKIPNPLHSYSGLFFSNSNIINKGYYELSTDCIYLYLSLNSK